MTASLADYIPKPRHCSTKPHTHISENRDRGGLPLRAYILLYRAALAAIGTRRFLASLSSYEYLSSTEHIYCTRASEKEGETKRERERRRSKEDESSRTSVECIERAAMAGQQTRGFEEREKERERQRYARCSDCDEPKDN